MNGNRIHFFVGPGPYKNDAVKYRRNRLAAYVSSLSDDDIVFWIYPLIRKFRFKNGFEEVSDRLYQLGVPDPLPYHLTSLNGLSHRVFTKKVEQVIQDFGIEKEMYLWYTFPIFPGLSKFEIWDRVIYDCSDNWGYSWRDPSKGISDKVKYWMDSLILNAWRSSENKILSNSNKVFVSSKYLKDKHIRKVKSELYLVENGVDYDKFKDIDTNKKTLKKSENIPRPRLGYIGGMKQKIDFPLLQKVASKNKKWNFVFIGPRYDNKEFNKILELENTYWLGSFRPEKIPQFCKTMDIGLMPYKKIEYNKGVFPLKFFEYLASGIPVVGCGLPSTKKYEQKGVYIHTKSNPSKFSKAINKTLNWNDKTIERKEIAKKADWKNKIKFIVKKALKE